MFPELVSRLKVEGLLLPLLDANVVTVSALLSLAEGQADCRRTLGSSAFTQAGRKFGGRKISSCTSVM